MIGCGYVGLALVMAYARAGFHVRAVDVSRDRVEKLSRGESYLMDLPTPNLREQVQAGRIEATSDYATVADADVIFVCVPTPFDRAKAPDLSYIRAAADGIARHLRAGQLVILESTTYPGTTEEVMLPILERSGLRVGRDFWLAFSPERIDPGNKTATIENTAKVVGGVDRRSTELAAEALRQVISRAAVHPVSSARAAELTKLLENVFRSVNIALVNELAQLCDRMGIDVWEFIDAASTKPYGFMPFFPGPGPGGHCIPVDPYYLSWKAREFDFSTKFIELAAETNASMPFFTVDKLRRFLAEDRVALRDARLLMMGAAFKRDIDDSRNSAAIRTMEILLAEGAGVSYFDPHVPTIRLGRHLFRDSGTVELRSVEPTDSIIASVDAVVILVGHRAVPYDRIATHAKRVFDAVNAMAKGSEVRGRFARL